MLKKVLAFCSISLSVFATEKPKVQSIESCLKSEKLMNETIKSNLKTKKIAIPTYDQRTLEYRGGNDEAAMSFFACRGIKINGERTAIGTMVSDSAMKSLNDLISVWSENVTVSEVNFGNENFSIEYIPKTDKFIINIQKNFNAILSFDKKLVAQLAKKKSLIKELKENDIQLKSFKINSYQLSILEVFYKAKTFKFQGGQINKVLFETASYNRSPHFKQNGDDNLTLVTGNFAMVFDWKFLLKFATQYTSLQSQFEFQFDSVSDFQAEALMIYIQTAMDKKTQVNQVIMDNDLKGAYLEVSLQDGKIEKTALVVGTKGFFRADSKDVEKLLTMDLSYFKIFIEDKIEMPELFNISALKSLEFLSTEWDKSAKIAIIEMSDEDLQIVIDKKYMGVIEKTLNIPFNQVITTPLNEIVEISE